VATADPSAWRDVSLPHDWSIALPIDHAAPAAGHGGYFPGGVGWYRRPLVVPAAWAGRHVELEFEGAYQDAEVWLNGVSIGRHHYGFTPFSLDLTPHLQPGADNLLGVRIDNSAQPSARWYTGSGLYRPVWLRVSNPVHLVAGGVVITTAELAEQRAKVRLDATVRNETATPCAVVLDTEIRDARDRKVASATAETKLAAGAEWTGSPVLEIRGPRPWSPESPVLYRAVTRIRVAGRVVDEESTSFGVRVVRVSAARGFELNGQPVKLYGGNVHSDQGVLGAAAFDRAEERKVELLKAAGFNAVRTAHNPPSTAFLAACDRRGLLVMDEIFDGWAKAKTAHDYSVAFKDDWARDVDAWIRRDRNHPSVVLWSAGNEMFERGNAEGLRLARELSAHIRSLDGTRPVTVGVNGLGKTGDWTQLDPLFAAFDVAGYNYELGRHAADHARLPERIILAAESYHSELFANWTALADQPYVIGDFVWSAFDYLGEAGLGRAFLPTETAKKPWEADMYPWHGANCGDIDLTGWRKPSSHHRRIMWDRGEKLYAAVIVPTADGRPWNLTPWSLPPSLPSWTWPGHEGVPLTVEVYSRHEAVRLELDGRVLGEKPTTRAEEFKAVFTVPYAPGELRVAGLRGGKVVETFVLATAGEPARLRLTADRSALQADGRDLAFVTVEAVDRNGRWNPNAALAVTFTVKGVGSLAGAGSGDLTAMDAYTGDTCHLHQGRALAVVRAGSRTGPVTLTVTAPGLAPASLTLSATQP